MNCPECDARLHPDGRERFAGLAHTPVRCSVRKEQLERIRARKPTAPSVPAPTAAKPHPKSVVGVLARGDVLPRKPAPEPVAHWSDVYADDPY